MIKGKVSAVKEEEKEKIMQYLPECIYKHLCDPTPLDNSTSDFYEIVRMHVENDYDT